MLKVIKTNNIAMKLSPHILFSPKSTDESIEELISWRFCALCGEKTLLQRTH